MKHILSIIVALAVLVPAVAGAGEKIKLYDPQAVGYGPADVVSGARIKVGGRILVVASLEPTAAHAALVKNTKSIPGMNFQEANVRDAVAFLRLRAMQSGHDEKRIRLEWVT